MKSTLKATLVATLLAASLAGCVVEPAHPHRPPPPPVEVVPEMPAPGYHWVPGHYRMGERDWIWVPGHWRVR